MVFWGMKFPIISVTHPSTGNAPQTVEIRG